MADSASFNGVAGVDARSLQRVALQISVVMAPPLHFTPKLPFELGQRREDAKHEAAAAVVVSICAPWPVSTRRPTGPARC